MQYTIASAIFARIPEVYQKLDASNLAIAKQLIVEIKQEIASYKDEYEAATGKMYLAGCLIDVGSICSDANMIHQGIEYIKAWLELEPDHVQKPMYLYNLANGYLAHWELKSQKHIVSGCDALFHLQARHYYREALDSISHLATQKDAVDIYSLCQLWTNYGSTLDTIGRHAEAIDAYDMALKLDPLMGMASGNKAIALYYLAPTLITHGQPHWFYLEAYRLLQVAVKDPQVVGKARSGFETKLAELEDYLEVHGDMHFEDIDSLQPKNDFHHFYCEFCAQNNLYLNPVNLVSDKGKIFYGDPMYISQMFSDTGDSGKFQRYATFLNEIKQDYVLGRYSLVQSQYQTDALNMIDEGVTLYDPLDCSLHSIYIQFLKSAVKQAVSVLDKIAHFIYDYCALTTPVQTDISFLSLFGGNSTMRKDLAHRKNIYLFALFTLSRDVSKDGDWHLIYDHRHALTHRFLVLQHTLGSVAQNDGIPRENQDIFFRQALKATQIARAAIIYLLLFVTIEEEKIAASNPRKPIRIPTFKITDHNRHRPNLGDTNV